MRTEDFIAQNIGNVPVNAKWCSSVLQNRNGDFFSYGEHYPLLFTIIPHPNYRKIWVRNIKGYSSSTGKHIGWAGGHGAIDVKLIGSNTSKKNVIYSLKEEQKELGILNVKGRKGSWAYEDRSERIDQINKSIFSILSIKK